MQIHDTSSRRRNKVQRDYPLVYTVDSLGNCVGTVCELCLDPTRVSWTSQTRPDVALLLKLALQRRDGRSFRINVLLCAVDDIQEWPTGLRC